MRKVLLLGAAKIPWYRAGGSAMPLAVYEPKGAFSQAASYINIVTPGTYNITAPTAPAWATGTGWKFNGSTQYLQTGIIPGSGWSMIIFYGLHPCSGTKVLAGCTGDVSATTRFWISPDSTGIFYSGGGSSSAVYARQMDGIVAVAGQAGYRGVGKQDVTGITAWSGAIDDEIMIGCLNNNGVRGNYTSAYIHAIAVYNSTLTQPQIAAVASAYIRKSYTKWFVFDGDSLTHGSYDNNDKNYPGRAIGKLTGAYSVINGVNFGIPAQKAADMLANVSTKITPQYVSGVQNTVALWAGTNDIWSTADSAATIHGYIQSYMQSCSRFERRVVMTILPTTNVSAPPDFETRRAAVNTLLRANYTNYATHLIDLDTDVRLTNPDDTTYYYGDKLHLLGTGYDIVADLFVAQVGP